jgi:hypothetical protein
MLVFEYDGFVISAILFTSLAYFGGVLLLVITALGCRKLGVSLPFRLKKKRIVFFVIIGLPIINALVLEITRGIYTYQFNSTITKLESCNSIAVESRPDITSVLKIDRLDKEEAEQLKKIYPNFMTTDDSNSIHEITNFFKKGRFVVPLTPIRVARADYFATFIHAYKNGLRTASIRIYWDQIININGYTYLYYPIEETIDFELPYRIYEMFEKTRPLALWHRCKTNLGWMHNFLEGIVSSAGKYPSPENWCDVLYVEIGDAIKRGYELSLPGAFICKAAASAGCHYAMNPYCEPNSPNDTVLLFETEAGWNQHGGAELMSFDHHEPRGCNVLFNDGIVRFIRPDEAANLNWGKSD